MLFYHHIQFLKLLPLILYELSNFFIVCFTSSMWFLRTMWVLKNYAIEYKSRKNLSNVECFRMGLLGKKSELLPAFRIYLIGHSLRKKSENMPRMKHFVKKCSANRQKL